MDITLVNQDFLGMFTNVKLTNLKVSTSDHSPLWLEPQIVVHAKFTKMFRFGNAWLREPICYQLVENAWNHESNRTFYEKLSQCTEMLSAWGQEFTGSFKTRINRCKNILKALKGRRDTASLKVAYDEMKNLSDFAQQEVFWRQRSKQLWLRERDQNVSSSSCYQEKKKV